MDIKQFESALENQQFPIDWPGHWVGGSWLAQPKGKTAKASTNPNNGKKLIEVQADKAAVSKALDSAQNARSPASQLSKSTLDERLGWLRSFRQCLGDYQKAAGLILQIESGKPRWECDEEIDASLRYMDQVLAEGPAYIESLARTTGTGVALQPLGITAAYLPFSTPVTSLAVYLSAALLSGCPLIIMPSSHAMLTAVLAGMIDEAVGLPKGLLNIVFGNFAAFRQLLGDRRVEAVIFTGSREHCETVRQESRVFLGRQLILQSGGKNSLMVHSSADLDLAVKCAAWGAFRSAGQLCTSTSRVFVYRSLTKDFCDRLMAAVALAKIGPTDSKDSTDRGPFMGPLYSEKAVEKFLRFQTMAHREAKDTLMWGKAVDANKGGGYFVQPAIHLLDRVDPASAYQSNVLFSPDLAIYEYDQLDDAIEQSNATDAPFVLSFIGDGRALDDRRHLILAPNIILNAPTVEVDATWPVAGRLQSGHFRWNGLGLAALLTYPQVMHDGAMDHKVLARWLWPQ